MTVRWNMFHGDVLYCDCTSSEPDKQFKAMSWLIRKHPEWTVDPDAKIFFWHRPPYAMMIFGKLMKLLVKCQLIFYRARRTINILSALMLFQKINVRPNPRIKINFYIFYFAPKN